jgi:uncharacterized membrane protein YeaQ/YmgE (transglycosylase-associated protein family)
MSIIAWIVVGAIAGAIANYVLGTPNGLIRTIIFGIVGAVVGGFVGGLLLPGADSSTLVSGINVTSIVVATIGALVVGGIGAWWSKRGSAA